MIRYLTEKQRSNIPFFIHMEVTEKCPLKCSQCYCNLEAGKEMRWEFCRKIIEEAGNWRIPKILITGGEPLTYKYLIDAIKLMSEYGIESVIATSGVGLNEVYCKKLKEAGIGKIFISLNGSNEVIHNYSRDRFKDAVNGIKLIKEAGIKCGINWVAREDNIDDFFQLLELGRGLAVDNIDILANKPDHFGKISSPVTSKELKDLAKKILSKYSEYKKGFVTVELCYPELRNMLSGEKIAPISKNCTAGRLFMEVNVDETFSACRHINYKMKRDTMLSYWNDEGRFGTSNSTKGCIY